MRLGRWKYPIVAVASVFVTLFVLAALTIPFSSDALRQRVIASLSDRLDSKVEVADFHARIFPVLHVEGSGLTIRHRGRTDVPPLISVASFQVNTGIIPLFRKHITDVKLAGLKIQIPPNRDDDLEAKKQPGSTAAKQVATNGSMAEGQESGKAERQEGSKAERRHRTDIVIDHLEASDASLVVLPDEAGVKPKVWSIHALAMHNVGLDTRMPFEATLTNAVPPGEITTSGSFGPWDSLVPGATPLEGNFTFEDANLAVFKGVYGTLSAHGAFGGTLGRIDINGETDTPDFGITTAAHSVQLHAKYHSIVDGTNGNTLLERIDASFLDTSLVAKGAVLSEPAQDGRVVSLDVAITDGRLEDLLQLAVKTPRPPMTGTLDLTTKFVLPPGDRDVVEKLRLNGRFTIADARFTDADIQKKINELSHRSRGRKPDVAPSGVRSGFSGQFRLRAAQLTLPSFRFSAPGADVRLSGGYGLVSEKLDFRGNLLMAAKVSDTTTGFKHLLLKAADPMFSKKGGGSKVPIKITGTRNDPHFGLDAGRILKR